MSKPAPYWRWRLFHIWAGICAAVALVACALPLSETLGYEFSLYIALLSSLGATDVAVRFENVPQRMAYPIDGYNVGIYVLFMYCAPSTAAKAIQQKLSAPSIEKEKSVLRFMTTRA